MRRESAALTVRPDPREAVRFADPETPGRNTMIRRVFGLLFAAALTVAVCASAEAATHPGHGSAGLTTWQKLSCNTVAFSGPADAQNAAFSHTPAALDGAGRMVGALDVFNSFRTWTPPTFGGYIDPPNLSWTLQNVPRTVYVQWQVPAAGGGSVWTTPDVVHAWSTCRAHFTVFHVRETATQTSVRWWTDRAAPPTAFGLYLDGGQTLVYRTDNTAGPIPHRIVLAPICGTRQVDAVVTNQRYASAFTIADGDSALVTGTATSGCLG
jgi:hypothetical protein